MKSTAVKISPTASKLIEEARRRYGGQLSAFHRAQWFEAGLAHFAAMPLDQRVTIARDFMALKAVEVKR